MHPIELRPISKQDFDLVRHIQVTDDQTLYSGTILQAFNSPETDLDFHAIFAEDRTVGFFKIDRGFGVKNDFARDGEIGLRGFMIDINQQGKGLGRTAACALRDYLPNLYPSAPSIALLVDMINPAAYACYAKAGFVDTGELLSKGLTGPQHIMRMSLSQTA
ncbi:GNAT family N-acetyltransferase [Parasedimentitalea huanghaiensis]|uniref:GNAT family N-acetyltransferase n=1 Tax=Parasedimentitalea huanghaiensis TaxID=2682100 RepID=A0A6L6WKL3_9RHOB|nr:GNAT family protein [Zongyanglinia huanghaiensis]MVO16282.1 GNAT family N-acetyltransferase [Zongyanglinia huanghaiensis]